MKVINSSKGIGGQLNAFKELVNDSSKIIFIGTAGFCTPFAELMAYVIRNKEIEMGFIPDLRADQAKTIISTSHGMQLGDNTTPEADTVVLLGGLAMPKIGVEVEDMKQSVEQIFSNCENTKLIGVCFQSIFQKQKWTDTLEFDYIIDSDMSTDSIDM